MKGRALRRALETADAHRVGGPTPIPMIVDTTECITPDVAYAMLLKNSQNRPINWAKVEEYAAIMRSGEWVLHAQGIVLDAQGNILTGQKRLWAVIYANVSIHMRVSRGTPPEAARVMDRGVPQSARDLAARESGRPHSPVEASIVRAVLALRGTLRPSVDMIAEGLTELGPQIATVLAATRGTKKTRAVLMVLAAICNAGTTADAKDVEALADALAMALHPRAAEECWGRGAAFSLAMGHARQLTSHPPVKEIRNG